MNAKDEKVTNRKPSADKTNDLPAGEQGSSTSTDDGPIKSVAAITGVETKQDLAAFAGYTADRQMKQRRRLAYLAFALPWVLLLGGLRLGVDPLASISQYYETIMVGVFVAVVFAIGFFLFSYVGGEPEAANWFNRNAVWWTNLAGLFAIVVALFPTKSDTDWVSTVHGWSAALMFVTLAVIAMVFFVMMEPEKSRGVEAEPTKPAATTTKEAVSAALLDWKASVKANWIKRVYVSCGLAIIVLIALIQVYYTWGEGSVFADMDFLGVSIEPVFWLEALALWAFALAWMLNGKFGEQTRAGQAVGTVYDETLQPFATRLRGKKAPAFEGQDS